MGGIELSFGAFSWIIAAVAVIVVGVSKSGFGAGAGILAIPLFVFALGVPSEAVGALLPLLIAADIFSVYNHWQGWDRKTLRSLWPFSAAGLAAGIALMYWLMGMPDLWWFPQSWQAANGTATSSSVEGAERQLRIGIGIICVLYVGLNLLNATLGKQQKFRRTGPASSAAGFASALVSMLAHAGGPVLSVFLHSTGLGRKAFVGTAVFYFFVLNLVKVVPYVLLGLINPASLSTGVWLLPLVPLGTWLGSRLNNVISDTLFRRVILGIVLISGIQLIIGNKLLLMLLP